MSRPWRRLVVGLVALAMVAALPLAQASAVSDGNYDNEKQGCTGNAFNSDQPDSTEAHCYITTVRIMDGTHDYVTIGIPMTKDGESPNSLEVCFDLGDGTRRCAMFGPTGVTPEDDQKGTPPDPASGLHVYFGMNDNIDNGEHDSSSQVNNGPSDGGGMQANVDPMSVTQWLSSAVGGGYAPNSQFLLTHPLPVADAGVGFCADGICMSAQTQRRVIFQGGDKHKSRDAANYDGKQWDPESCSGPSDTPKDCGHRPLKWWDKREGTVYAEPGVQIYEDPDAQGSPIGPYPLPGIYVGTCGLVIGGAQFQAPDSPFTNKAGQFVVTTGC